MCDIECVPGAIQVLYQTFVFKRELSQKEKLSIYHSAYVLALTYCLELYVVTK